MVYLLPLVYNQEISLITLTGVQQGIKRPMISHRNKSVNKSTMPDFVRSNKHHLDVLMTLNEDNRHQLDN